MLTNSECQIDEIRRVRLTKLKVITNCCFFTNLNVNIHLMFLFSVILTPKASALAQ